MKREYTKPEIELVSTRAICAGGLFDDDTTDPTFPLPGTSPGSNRDAGAKRNDIGDPWDGNIWDDSAGGYDASWGRGW